MAPAGAPRPDSPLARLQARLAFQLNLLTDRTHALPLVVLMVNARCNNRCRTCDIWRAALPERLGSADLAAIGESLTGLGTRVVALSGGEPLLRRDLFALADGLLARGMRLRLMTNGLLLERHAAAIAGRFEEVAVSLDGATPDTYRAIRGVDGLELVLRGIDALKAQPRAPRLVTRTTVQRGNFREIGSIIDLAAAAGADAASFLAADVVSTAFGHTDRPDPRDILLDASELAEFAHLLAELPTTHAGAFARGFVAEPPSRLFQLHQFYAACLGLAEFPPVACAAPWASLVVEASGEVRPCFFQPPIGSLRQQPLHAIARSPQLTAVRRRLRRQRDPLCARCVCTLRWGGSAPIH